MTVAIAIPEDAPPGTYRGVISTRSAAPAGRRAAGDGLADAWSLLELEVKAAESRRPRTAADRPPS